MKKHIKMFMIALVISVLSLSMVLGLSGCSKVNEESFATAQEEWNNARDKTATDNLSLDIALPLAMAKDLKISVSGKITRKYIDGKVNKVTGSVNSIKVTGLGDLIKKDGAIGTLLDMFIKDTDTKTKKQIFDEIFDAIEQIAPGGVVDISNIVDGSIRETSGKYYFEGNVNLGTALGGMFDLKDLETEEPASIDKDLIDGIIKVFTDDEINLDMLSFYDLNTATIKTVNRNTLQADINPSVALKGITDLLFAKISAFMAGELDEDIRDTATELGAGDTTEIFDILEDVKGYLNSLLVKVFDTDDFEEIIDMLLESNDTVNARLNFNKDKLSKIEFQQNATVTINKTQVTKALEEVLDILRDNGVAIPSIINSAKSLIMNMVFGSKTSTLEITATLKVNTTLEY